MRKVADAANPAKKIGRRFGRWEYKSSGKCAGREGCGRD